MSIWVVPFTGVAAFCSISDGFVEAAGGVRDVDFLGGVYVGPCGVAAIPLPQAVIRIIRVPEWRDRIIWIELVSIEIESG